MTIESALNERNRDYAWSFGEPVPDELDDFISAFTEYNTELDPDVPVRDFQLLDAPATVVRFSGIPDNDEADDYVDMEVSIQAEDGGPLRFLEFMFRLHTQVARFLERADYEFYEGLTFVKMRDGVPVLQLMQGS